MGAVHAESMSAAELNALKKKKIAKIWMVAGILSLVTAVEFLLAFTMPSGMGRNIIFIVLTIVKAFYIVAEFMHLGHEKKGLVWVIIYPYILFIGWLILALMYEGYKIFEILDVVFGIGGAK